MSGDELKIRRCHPAQPIPDDYIGNMDAVVEVLMDRYKFRHQMEMDWRLMSILESAYKAGALALLRTEGWSPQCNQCGERVTVKGVDRWTCPNGCHER